MFTDNPVTPNRIEVLIDVLRDYSRREWARGDLVSVLAPSGLPDLTPSSKQASDTIAAAKELHARGGFPNLYIKIPGTKEGLPAIEEAIFAGVPVNVTLLFSREHYLAAADAFLRLV